MQLHQNLAQTDQMRANTLLKWFLKDLLHVDLNNILNSVPYFLRTSDLFAAMTMSQLSLSCLQRLFWCHTTRYTLFVIVLVLLISLLCNTSIRNTQHRPEEWGKEWICFNPPLSDDPTSLAAVPSLEPPTAVNPSCAPPTFPPLPSCQDPAFTGKLQPKKMKLIHMILFGFEVICAIFGQSEEEKVSGSGRSGGHFGDPSKRDGWLCWPVFPVGGHPHPQRGKQVHSLEKLRWTQHKSRGFIFYLLVLQTYLASWGQVRWSTL